MFARLKGGVASRLVFVRPRGRLAAAVDIPWRRFPPPAERRHRARDNIPGAGGPPGVLRAAPWSPDLHVWEAHIIRVGLVTCAAVADLDPDDRLIVGPLAARGVHAEPVVWDAHDADWSAYDLVVLRSTWDYPQRRQEFVAWARGVGALANSSDVVEWNTDKRYLAELAAAGLPVVPTAWLAPGESWTPPATGEYVIKPSVGAGSLDTERYRFDEIGQRRRASAHLARLHAADRDVMIQPYLSAVDSTGETALLFLGGRYSHAVRKGPMLTEEDSGAYTLYRPEEITLREPTIPERAVGEQALAAVPGGKERLLYARVDLIPGPDGAPLLLEVELTEPSLFLAQAAGAPERFADAIVASLRAADISSPRPPTPRKPQ